MSKDTLTGGRIRARRIDSGIKQAALAEACQISPSYLNLIEHNRRRIGGALLNRIARALDVDPAQLSGGAEPALTTALTRAAAQFPAVGAEVDEADSIAGRFPGWARLLQRQAEETERLQRAIDVLNDRLTFDPHLAASLHDVLSTVTSIRSTSAILAEGDPVEKEWQDRFHRNLYEDSQRLAESAEGLVAYLDRSADASQSLNLPQDDLEVWLARREWRIEALEENPDADPASIVSADPPGGSAVQSLALQYLGQYARDVRAMPRTRLLDAIGRLGPEPLDLADALGANLALILRRLATLPDGVFAADIAPGLVIADASGTLTFRKPVVGFELPRYGAACPIWPMFQAIQRPGTPITQALEKDGRDGRRFRATAIANQSFPAGYAGPPVVETVMLLQPRSDTDEPVLRVGTSCRICSIEGCSARREPTILSQAGRV